MKKVAALISLFLVLTLNVAYGTVEFRISVHANNVTVEANVLNTVEIASLHNKVINETAVFTVSIAWQPDEDYGDALTIAYPSTVFLASNQSELLKANITSAISNATFSGKFVYTAQSDSTFIGQRESTVVITAKPEAEDRPKFGVSDREEHVNMGYNEEVTVVVARVYNAGSFDLHIKAEWKSDNKTMGVSVVLDSTNFVLLPDQSKLITVTASSASLNGTFTGKIELDSDLADPPAGYVGPRTAGGGSAHVTFHVGDWKQPYSFPFIPVLAVAGLAVAGVGVAFGYKKRRGKIHHVRCERCDGVMRDEGNRYVCKNCGLTVYKRE